jgi:tetratricopeptide (TPR) repeat protein
MAMRLFLIALALVCAVGHADEGDRDLARKRYEMGMLLYKRGKFADALKELQAAKAAFDRPEFDYNIGLCLAKLDRPAEAAEALDRFVSARPDDPETPAIRARIVELRSQLPKPPPEPVVTEAPPPPPPPRPGEEPLPPGEVAARAAAVEAARRPPAPPQPSGFAAFARSPYGIATFTLAGVGVASLLTAAITGGVALSQNGSYRDGCNSVGCDYFTWESAHRLGIATDVLLSIGIASAVAATVVGLVAPKQRKLAWGGRGLTVSW